MFYFGDDTQGLGSVSQARDSQTGLRVWLSRSFAQLLDENEAAELLQETLDEEGEADKLLTQLAQDIVNPEALLEDAEAEATGSRSR